VKARVAEMPLAFAPARPSDDAGIRQMLIAGGLPASDLTERHLAHFFVCRADDSIVGTVGIEPAADVALLRSLAVAPAYRANGLGAALVQLAEAHAATLGATDVYLLTTSAERFFAMRGYRSIPRDSAPQGVRATTEFATICPATAICMTKRLSR
jgi:amino-acid N-acetyltransferase